MRLLLLTLALAGVFISPTRSDGQNNEITKLERLAAQGDAEAQYILGARYDEGRGVPQDYAKAMEWYTKAAAQGFAVAQYNLGLMYAKGNGVPQDYVQAHKWADLAASKGHKEAVKIRDILIEMMTPDQIAEAQRLAREWKPKPAQP